MGTFDQITAFQRVFENTVADWHLVEEPSVTALKAPAQSEKQYSPLPITQSGAGERIQHTKLSIRE